MYVLAGGGGGGMIRKRRRSEREINILYMSPVTRAWHSIQAGTFYNPVNNLNR